jgi:hypothetical protein
MFLNENKALKIDYNDVKYIQKCIEDKIDALNDCFGGGTFWPK